MTISSFKDLEKLIKLCRKTGVDEITVDGITMKLGDVPLITSNKKVYENQIVSQRQTQIPGISVNLPPMPAEMQVPHDGLTDEQLLFYSAASADPTFEQN